MTLFLDLDGVLVNFIAGICAAHGRPTPWESGADRWEWDFHHSWQMDDQEFWKPADGAQFWAGLDWMPDGREILATCERIWDPDNICLLSHPEAPGSLAGKATWIVRHTPRYQNQYLLGRGKAFCAHKRSVLVDDRDSNVEQFEQAGGRTVLVPRPWNRGYWNREVVGAVASGLRAVRDADYGW